MFLPIPAAPLRSPACDSTDRRRRAARIVGLLLAAVLSSGRSAEAEEAAGLAPRFERWLEEARLLLSEEELELFLSLEEDYQRDGFIERFWEARDPLPRTERNEFRENWRRRVEFARSHFYDLSRDDRSPALLFGGEPNVRLVSPCTTLFRRNLEMWLYAESDQIAREHGIIFVGTRSDVPFREWQPGALESGTADRAILELVRDNEADLRRSCEIVRRDGRYGVTGTLANNPSAMQVVRTNPLLACVIEQVHRSCGTEEKDHVAMTLLAVYQGGLVFGTLSGQGGRPIVEQTRGRRLQRPEPRSREWLEDFRALGTGVPDGAAIFPIALRTLFAPAEGPRTTLRGVVEVDPEAVAVGEIDGHHSRSFQLHGEILRGGALHESFRVRYDLPDTVGGTLPLIFDRLLRPGRFELRVRVEDVHGGGFGRAVASLEVPRLDPDDPVGPAVDGRPSDLAGLEGPPLRLVAPPGEQHTGMQRFDVEVSNLSPDRVEFLLDGRSMLVRKRPPYTVELDLGPVPRIHRIRAIAWSEDDRLLGSDELELNLGPHRFGVRLLEPSLDPGSGTLTIRSAVQVPDGERIERLEFSVDGRSRGALTEPPWSLTVPVSGSGVRVVEARGLLASGLEAEDTLLLGGSGLGERIDVRLVEVWASLLGADRRPVHGIARSEVEVLEDGEIQELLRFEEARGLPLTALMVLDTSTSMEARLEEVREGALAFLGSVRGSRDRVGLVTFSSRPTLAIELTRDLEPFRERVATLRAEGSTALWDAVVFALRYFNGVQGQRAIVLLTDGNDESSRHTFAEAKLHAETAGVALYPIGISIAKNDLDTRFRLSRLAEVTGGRVFYVDAPDMLPAVYEAIEVEVRSKYLLAYQSQGEGTDFREVEVRTARPGVVVEAMRGYFP